MRELPLLNERRCIGCGDCVTVCPTDCLTMTPALGPGFLMLGQGLPTLPHLSRPLDCISCAVCVAVCPVDALTLTPPVAA